MKALSVETTQNQTTQCTYNTILIIQTVERGYKFDYNQLETNDLSRSASGFSHHLIDTIARRTRLLLSKSASGFSHHLIDTIARRTRLNAIFI